ncbi:hypothetical protein COOONC_25032, partial [Cooperia oncophora]
MEEGFEAVVREMERLLCSDSTAARMRALNELRSLKLRSNQSISEFCVVLEKLAHKANPDCTIAERSLEYAQILLDNLGHIARNCPLGRPVVRNIKERKTGSNGRKETDRISDIVREAQSMGIRSEKRSSVANLVGEKSSASVKMLHGTFPALIDTGSMVSIVPVGLLERAQKKSEIAFYISKEKGQEVLLGTNALEKLGVHIKFPKPTNESMQGLSDSGKVTIENRKCAIPVINEGSEPMMLKEGEEIGQWSTEKWKEGWENLEPVVLDELLKSRRK